MSPPRKSSRGRSFGLRFLSRLIGWSFPAALALVVITYLALPALLRYGLPHALARYGLASSVEGARISLTDGRVTLVDFQLGPAGGPGIRWGEVEARVDMAELLKGNIRIIDFQVKDARVDLAQLRASKWKPPESAAAIPELGKLNVDIGNVVLRDLEFIGLSERIGQKVGLRSLSVGSLSQLEAGARAAFELEGFVDDASVRLAGWARVADGLPVFEGRYQVGDLDLVGFGQMMALPTPGSLGGKVEGDGTFALAYLQGDGEVHAKLSGNARVDGLELDSGDIRVTDTVAGWSGDAEIFWHLAAGLPRVIARGSVESTALRAARRSATDPYAILARGFRWSGELRHGGELETEGRISSDVLRIDSSFEGTPRFGIELSSFGAESRFRAGRRGYEFETAELVAESATLLQGMERGRQSLIAYRVVLEQVRLATGGHRIGRLQAESAEATFVEAGETTPSRGARFFPVGAQGIEIRSEGGAFIDRLDVDHAGLDSPQVSIDLGQARATGVDLGVSAPFQARTLSASSLRQKTGVFETWGSNLQFSGAGVSASGEVFFRSATAESLSQTISGDPLWEAGAASATRLAIGSTRIEASGMNAARFAYGKFGGTLIEIDGAEWVDLSIRYASGIQAARLKLESMRYRGGQFTRVELAAAEMSAPGIGFGGQLWAKSIDAGSVGYSDAYADRYRFHGVKLLELSGSLAEGLRMDAAHAGQLTYDRAVGADYRARGLDLSRMALSAAGGVSANALRLAGLEVDLADGERLTLEDAVAANPGVNAGGRFDAAGGRIRSLVYTIPGGRNWRLVEVQFGAVDNEDNEDHRIELVSAAGATASDPGVEGEFETGALQVVGLRISSDGKVHADLASASSVSLAGYPGNPPPAFTSARVDSRKLVLEPGGRLRLGEVLLDDSRLTAGLDDGKAFVLPRPSFLPAEREFAGNLTIQRLQARRPARVTFFDQSTSPAFGAVIASLQVQLENLHGGDSRSRARFTLDGVADGLSNLEAAGEFSMETGGLNLETSGRLTALALERLSPYLAKVAGGTIQSGRGDVDFDIAVRGRKLSGTLRLIIDKVQFQRADDSATAGTWDGHGLTLEKSLAMLEDGDGLVRLTLPLSASLDDPDYHFSDLLLTALSRTLRGTVMSTFEPLGLMNDSRSLELKPLAFEPGEHELSGEGLARLDVLAVGLNGHPAVDLQLCGRAVSADRIRLEQRRGSVAATSPATDAAVIESANVDVLLHDLARQRASAVRGYLQEKRGVSQHRLIACEAEVESVPGLLPRVELPVRVETELKAARSEPSPG